MNVCRLHECDGVIGVEEQPATSRHAPFPAAHDYHVGCRCAYLHRQVWWIEPTGENDLIATHALFAHPLASRYTNDQHSLYRVFRNNAGKANTSSNPEGIFADHMWNRPQYAPRSNSQAETQQANRGDGQMDKHRMAWVAQCNDDER